MEELGKAVGSDEKNHKTTYVTLEGIKKAGEDVKELTKEALNLLMELPGEQEFFKRTASFTLYPQKIEVQKRCC